jgi:uncharacterized protein (UPF0297 family)
MKLDKLLDTTPEQLAKLQFEELKREAVETLRNFTDLLDNEKFQEIEKLIGYSPAGDDMGCDNQYIKFNHIHKSMDDIGDVLNKLVELKKLIKK